MPTFELSANGKTFEIEAPDQGAAVSAFQKMQGDQPSVAADVAKSAGVGVGKGAIGLAGMVGDLSDLGAKGIEAATNYVSGKLGIEPYKPPMDRSKSILNNIPTSGSIQKAVEQNVTGEFYKPQTTPGKYAETIGEFLPAAVVGPGSAASRVATAMAAGAGSEAAGQASQGTVAEPYARVAGAIAGGLTPAGVARAVTPMPTSAARQRLVQVLNDEGVTSLTAGQRTGNKSLQYAESFLGDGPLAGQGATAIQREGQEQFTRAAMRRAGRGLDDATPETLAANHGRLTQEFQDLSARNTLTPDNQFITDLTTAVRDYRNVPNSQQRAMVQGYVDDIIGHVNAGQMPGVQYQEMRSRLSRQANSLRESDPTLADALRDMRNALDNAMERSLAGTADAGAWGQARREYGAQRTIEKTASRAGELTAEGQLVPANLRNTVSAENRGAYARGQGEFSELARAGAGVMAPLPNSGTAQRNALTNLALLPVSATAGRVLASRPVQAYLGNQVLTDQLANMSPARINVLRALLSQQRPQLEAQPR